MKKIDSPILLTSVKRQSGVGLVEIMVAMAVGLFLTAGVLQIYIGSRQSYRTTESLSRMQENLRFAAEMIANDIRMAGFMPCRMTARTVNVLTPPTGVVLDDFFSFGINGFDGDHADGVTGAFDHGSVPLGGTAAGIPATGTTAGDHVAGTDVVKIIRGDEGYYNIVSHSAGATPPQFTLNNIGNLVPGDIAVVCNIGQSALFQVSATTATTIQHDAGSPGNCTAGLGFPRIGFPPTCSRNNYTFGTDSHLIELASHNYFIGTSATAPGGRALHSVRLQNNAGAITMVTNEMVQGIENMQLLYGVDTTGDDNPDRFVRADQVLDVTGAWTDVVAVRLGLLAQTPQEITNSADTGTYNLAGTSVPPAAADRRQRYVYNTTIKMRNRGQR